jgi:hypothetical protein
MFGLGRGRRGVVGPRVQQALNLLSSGHYVEAGELLGQLGDRARANGNHLRSARLALQAGRAFIQANEADRAMVRTRQSVQQFIVAGRPGRAVQVMREAAAVFRSRGWNTQAAALERDMQARLAEKGLSLADAQAETVPVPHGVLPPTCPRCGGPLRDAEWIDSLSAECPYCDSVVRAEVR